ncbi:MAG: hypothetical protein HRT69_11990 [Flavobacteriaceae bacterium]|nr:hypothetical protein [Flavobacteriaceae bacterium]
MKNLIQLFALLVFFTFTSCTIENDSYDFINEQENNISDNSYKTATIIYDSSINLIALDELKEELKVEKFFSQDNENITWVMYNNKEIKYLEEFIMFTDGVLGVDVVEGEHVSDNEKDGDTVGDGTTTGDDE